jgi:cytochrome P450
MFATPAEFHVERERNPHLVFGYGLHHCGGAPLARGTAHRTGRALRPVPIAATRRSGRGMSMRADTVVHNIDRLPVVW